MFIKGEGHSWYLLFWSSPIANIQLVHSLKFQPLKCLLPLRVFFFNRSNFSNCQGQQNLFFPITSPSSMLPCWRLDHVWLKSSHNLKQQLKGLSGAIWTNLLKLCQEKVTWLPSTFQNSSSNVCILGFFRDEFHKENLHFRG